MAKKTQKKPRPAKHAEPLKLAQSLMASGRLLFSPHAQSQMKERRLLPADIRNVINHGRHEKSKDQFDDDWKVWKYAVLGKSVDFRNVRVPIAFEEGDTLLLIVTAIDLDKEGES